MGRINKVPKMSTKQKETQETKENKGEDRGFTDPNVEVVDSLPQGLQELRDRMVEMLLGSFFQPRTGRGANTGGVGIPGIFDQLYKSVGNKITTQKPEKVPAAPQQATAAPVLPDNFVHPAPGANSQILRIGPYDVLQPTPEQTRLFQQASASGMSLEQALQAAGITVLPSNTRQPMPPATGAMPSFGQSGGVPLVSPSRTMRSINQQISPAGITQMPR